MLSIKAIENGEGLVVSGYPQGTDWLIYCGRQYGLRPRDYSGIAGDRYVWLVDTNKNGENQRLRIWDAVEQRPHATLDFGSGVANAVSSRNGRLVYVLHSKGGLATLSSVDLAEGKIIRKADELPNHWLGPVIVRMDGKVIYQHHEDAPDKKRLDGLVLVDPETGGFEVDLQATGLEDMDERCFQECLFRNPSPDGRYWLRHDMNALPVHKASNGKPLYGLTLQLWEAFPLKFVRRIVVAWVDSPKYAEELRVLAAAATASDVGPLGNIPRSAFPAKFAKDNTDWFEFQSFRKDMGIRTGIVDWQPDGQAFWVMPAPGVSCVGIDGTISPQLHSERARIHGNMSDWPKNVTALPGRRARAEYMLMRRHEPVGVYSGTVEFDGSPSPTPFVASVKSMADDSWVAFDQAAEAKTSARLSKLKNEGRTLIVSLSDMTEQGCIAAIDALAGEMNGAFASHAIDDEVRVVFKSKAKSYGEDKFFAEVAAKYPAAAPALRRLVEAYAGDENNSDLYWNGERGIAALGHGVLALGLLDAEAFPTIERYAAQIDGEHEQFFIQKTVPALFKTHGWTDLAIDFGVWLMFHDGSPTFYEFSTIWKRWGMGKAVMAKMTPEAFAARLAKHFLVDPAAMHHLAEGFEEKFPQPNQPWMRAVFKELSAIVPGWPQ